MKQTLQEVEAYFNSNNLAGYWNAFSSELKPCIRIKYEASEANEVSIGGSKLGGLPDLPLETGWAVFDAIPLSFLAQINLAELPNCEIRDLLPRNGLLSFFYSCENHDYASSPHKVMFSDAISGLERKARPDDWSDDEIIYRTGKMISAEMEQSLPSGETEYVLDVFKDDNASRWTYWTFVRPDNSEEATNKMFGYPDDTDDNFELICECISKGDKEFTQLKTFTEKQKAEIQSKWILLFQLDSNLDLEMWMGADLNCFYFWITKEDLANENFSRTVAFSFH